MNKNSTGASYKYTELKFNIEDVCVSVHYTHRFNTKDGIPAGKRGEGSLPERASEYKFSAYSQILRDVLLPQGGYGYILRGGALRIGDFLARRVQFARLLLPRVA